MKFDRRIECQKIIATERWAFDPWNDEYRVRSTHGYLPDGEPVEVEERFSEGVHGFVAMGEWNHAQWIDEWTCSVDAARG